MRLPIPEHEVGHTVVALSLGIEIVSVSCFPGRTECGAEFTRSISQSDVPPAAARCAALFCLGGIVYENLLAELYDHGGPIAPRRPGAPTSGADGARDDLYEAYRFADALGGASASGRTIVELMSFAITILRRNLIRPGRSLRHC